MKINEYAHDLTEAELKGLVVQVTGLEEASSTFKSIIGSFNALKAFADFSAPAEEMRRSWKMPRWPTTERHPSPLPR